MPSPLRSRRSDILAAACREFAERGYTGGRIEHIAAAAQVNKQLLFHYFGSKEGLFSAAVIKLLEDQRPNGEPAGSPGEALRRSVAVLQAMAEAIPSLGALIAEASSPGRLPAPAASELLAWRDKQLEHLMLVLEEGQRRGYFRDDIDPLLTARLAFAASIGASLLEGVEPAVSPGALLVDYCTWR